MKTGQKNSSDLAHQHIVVLCGDTLLHRKLLKDYVSATAGHVLISCSEKREALFAVCRRLDVSLIIANQAFLEVLPNADLLDLTKYGRGANILAILEANAPETVGAEKMLRLGCRGVLPNGFSSKVLGRAVLAILKGELWAPRMVVSELLSDLLRATSLKAVNGLTPQEARILELTAEGYKNSAIAETLFISLETVRWHKRRLNRKLRGADQAPRVKAKSPHREVAAG